MRKALLKPDIKELIQGRGWTALRQALSEWPPPEVADLLTDLDKSERVLLFRSLSRDMAAEVFAHLELEQRNALLRELTDEETRALLSDLSPDDRTSLLEELPGEVTQRLLNFLTPADLAEARALLGYPEESVGRLMTPDYIAVRPNWTVEQALAHIRQQGREMETVNVVYVVDANWRLQDELDLRRLIFAEPSQRVEEIMDHTYASVIATADREEAVRLIRRYDVIALPVVDSKGVLLGIVTVDDVMDVAEEEATEDFHKLATVGPIQTSLRDATVGLLFRRRIGWLLTLVGINVFASAAIAMHEETLAASIALVFFLPLLIDSSGNAGSQAATLMVRALATGDVKGKDWFGLLGKELLVASLMGLAMAVAVSMVGVLRAPEVIPIVAMTMFLVVIIGSVTGMSLPFILSRMGADPATASAPLVTSIADITGVLIYFGIASWYLLG
jgi:magnesium transporter